VCHTEEAIASFTRTHTTSLVSALQTGLQKRFDEILNFDDVHNNNKMKAFVVAAVAHPYFKVRWLSTSLRKVAEDLFLAEVTRLGESCCRPQANEKADISEDFYSFSMHDSDSKVADSGCKAEALQFLNDPLHELQQMRKYPVVARVFVKYNTIVQSSAPVERLFSQAGLILTPCRNKLSDESFETLLLRKKNKKFA